MLRRVPPTRLHDNLPPLPEWICIMSTAAYNRDAPRRIASRPRAHLLRSHELFEKIVSSPKQQKKQKTKQRQVECQRLEERFSRTRGRAPPTLVNVRNGF